MHPRELIPWRRFTIETSWAPAFAFGELQQRIDPPLAGALGLLGALGTRTAEGIMPFIGRQTGGVELTFSRRITMRNSFLPVIRVVVEPSHHDGARLNVTMHLHELVMAFMGLWLSGATIGAVTVAVVSLTSGQPAGLLALAFPTAGAALCTIPFMLEARIAERLLREIFESAPGYDAPLHIGPHR